MSKRLSKLAAAVPQSEAEVEAMIAATLKLQTDSETLIASRDALIHAATAAIEKEHGHSAKLNAISIDLARNLEVLETWAVLNKKKHFKKAKSIRFALARIGWRLGNWKTKLRSKTKWLDVVEKLEDFVSAGQGDDASEKQKARADLAEEYLRREVSPDKEAMLRDRAIRAARALLKKCGVIFEQDETFFVQPDREGQQPATLTAS